MKDERNKEYIANINNKYAMLAPLPSPRGTTQPVGALHQGGRHNLPGLITIQCPDTDY